MKTITTTNQTKLTFLTKANEITAKRWNRFNTEAIKASELGPDFMSAASKLDAMNNHLKFGNNQAWKAENENLRLQLFSTYNGINCAARAVAFLLHKIDGTPFDPFELPLEELDELVECTEISQEDVQIIISETRKK